MRNKIIEHPVAACRRSHSSHTNDPRQLVTSHQTRPETHLRAKMRGRTSMAKHCGHRSHSVDGKEPSVQNTYLRKG